MQDIDEDVPEDPLVLGDVNKRRGKTGRANDGDQSPWNAPESFIQTAKEKHERETGQSIKG